MKRLSRRENTSHLFDSSIDVTVQVDTDRPVLHGDVVFVVAPETVFVYLDGIGHVPCRDTHANAIQPKILERGADVACGIPSMVDQGRDIWRPFVDNDVFSEGNTLSCVIRFLEKVIEMNQDTGEGRLEERVRSAFKHSRAKHLLDRTKRSSDLELRIGAINVHAFSLLASILPRNRFEMSA